MEPRKQFEGTALQPVFLRARELNDNGIAYPDALNTLVNEFPGMDKLDLLAVWFVSVVIPPDPAPDPA